MNKLKSKLIVIISIAVIIIGATYQLTKKEEVIEIDYQNVIIENSENTLNEVNTENKEENSIIKVHVAGQVKNTGIIELEEGERISDAIEKAGGLTEKANLDEVNLAYCLQDGQKLYIPSIEEKDVEYLTENNGENIIQETNAKSSNKIININKADESQLEEIPGVGPSMAQKIVNYRKENGNFKSVDDLKNVSGIGEKKFESMKEYITVK